jgi:hypothetical protein
MGNLLDRTLASLALGGFSQPRLFVDNCPSHSVHAIEQRYNLQVTARYPRIRTFGNWLLSAAELYIRNPHATRYAIFQDDMVTYPHLREYLEETPYPTGGYCNLYTFPSNQALAAGREGWYPSNQYGRGAVALVFDWHALSALLCHRHMIERPKDIYRGYRSVDGGIVTAMQKAGILEYVHNPSLVQHTGLISSMGNKKHLLAVSFRGEGYNALEMVQRNTEQ